MSHSFYVTCIIISILTDLIVKYITNLPIVLRLHSCMTIYIIIHVAYHKSVINVYVSNIPQVLHSSIPSGGIISWVKQVLLALCLETF